MANLTRILFDTLCETPALFKSCALLSAAQEAIRTEAERCLLAAESQDIVGYLEALCVELADDTKPDATRQVAGIMVKNSISGKTSKTDVDLRKRWISAIPRDKQHIIKQELLKTLKSPSFLARNVTTQIVAKIARLEIVENGWPELFPTIDNLVDPQNTTPHRSTAYQLLGYICEDLQILSDEVGKDLLDENVKKHILTALSRGLIDQDLEVKLAAMKAFYFAILFAEPFMRTEVDRTSLFQILGECLSCPNEEVELAGWEVMLQAVTEFYDYLEPFLPAILALSLDRMAKGSSHQKTSLSAIEFWSTICDEELMLANGDTTRSRSRNYIMKHSEVLLPALFEATANQTMEDTDEDDWTVSMAAGTSISLCALLLKNHIIQPAFSFVGPNFVSPSWNRREAAVLVYGSVLEGPTNFGTLLNESIEGLCSGLNDPSVAVRDTTAWTIGRIVKFHFHTIASAIDQLITILSSRLLDVPRVASNVCFALYEVCAQTSQKGTPNPLDAHFAQLSTNLLSLAQTSKNVQLGRAACHALFMLIKQVSSQTSNQYPLVTIKQSLIDWMNLFMSSPKDQYSAAMIGPVCGCLNAVISRLGHQVISEVDVLFSLLKRITDAWSPVNSVLEPSAIEEALLAFNQLIFTINHEFTKYLDVFMPTLLQFLSYREDADLCGIAIDIASNIITHMHSSLDSHRGHELVTHLMSIINDNKSPMVLKPKAMTALSDVAIMAPETFRPHIKDLQPLLILASNAKLQQGPTDSDEWVTYITDLRDSTMLAYIGILYCIRETENSYKQHAYEGYFAPIQTFLQMVLKESQITDSNLKHAIMLVEDLIAVAGPRNLRNVIEDLQEKCTNSQDESVKRSYQLLAQRWEKA